MTDDKRAAVEGPLMVHVRCAHADLVRAETAEHGPRLATSVPKRVTTRS